MKALLARVSACFTCSYRRPCRLLSKDGTKLSSMEVGKLGERIAANYLVAHGRKILYRNYRGPKGGEIDLVTRDGNTLAFVEVKTRTRKGYGRPLDAVNATKQQLIERGANSWIKLLNQRDMVWRFDVVEVILADGEAAQLNVVKNAF